MITGSYHSEPVSHVEALKSVQSQADRYLRAVYGDDYVYRAPETYVNLVERWMYSIVCGEVDVGDQVVTQIEQLTRSRRDVAADPIDEEDYRG